jgi:hypothetical protein
MDVTKKVGVITLIGTTTSVPMLNFSHFKVVI